MRTDIEVPERIARLPKDQRGYPVPWFVQWFADATGQVPTKDGVGVPDFRVVNGMKVAAAVNQNRCFICGGILGRLVAFPVGPMCGINRVSAEPPSHRECAEFSTRVCPFLSQPKMEQREGGVSEEVMDPGGVMIRRNPGVTLVWVTTTYVVEPTPPNGFVFKMGPIVDWTWWAEGRRATRGEVEASIASGLPILQKMAEEDGAEAVAELERQRERAMRLLPGKYSEPNGEPKGDSR